MNVRKGALAKAWEMKLSKFDGLFVKRREQFKSVMTSDVAIDVDEGRVELDAIMRQNEELSEKCVVLCVSRM